MGGGATMITSKNNYINLKSAVGLMPHFGGVSLSSFIPKTHVLYATGLKDYVVLYNNHNDVINWYENTPTSEGVVVLLDEKNWNHFD